MSFMGDKNTAKAKKCIIAANMIWSTRKWYSALNILKTCRKIEENWAKNRSKKDSIVEVLLHEFIINNRKAKLTQSTDICLSKLAEQFHFNM